MSTVSVSMKLTPKQAGTLYMKNIALEKEINELKAQVERLRKPLSSLVKSCRDRGCSLEQDGHFAYKVKDYIFKGAKDVLDLTPAQCLAEIKAQAGRDGFIAGLEYPDKVRFEGATRNPVFAADEYAKQIRQQVKGE